MAKNWPKIIAGLRRLLSEVGDIWPKSTKLSGFASQGPYYCGMCEYLKRDSAGRPILDAQGFSRCIQEVVKADPEVKKDFQGIPIIHSPATQCCEWVDRYEKK